MGPCGDPYPERWETLCCPSSAFYSPSFEHSHSCRGLGAIPCSSLPSPFLPPISFYSVHFPHSLHLLLFLFPWKLFQASFYWICWFCMESSGHPLANKGFENQKSPWTVDETLPVAS